MTLESSARNLISLTGRGGMGRKSNCLDRVALLEAHDLTRRYGDRLAVSGVGLTLQRGEVLGLLGPNGAGKSTCMGMLTGNLAPDAGRVLVQGIDLWRDPVRAKAYIGYLPEIPPLYPDQRVDEYLEYAARLHRVPPAGVTAALRDVKRRCGLGQVGLRLIGRLSKGYRQRVGIAQALLHAPPLVILDEPTVGLDPGQIHEVRDLIRGLGREHGVLLSTHLLAEVQVLCTRVLILHRGRVVHAGQVADATGHWLVGLERSPAAVDLRALPEVGEAGSLGAGRFRVRLAPGVSSAELARSLIIQGLGLLELSPEKGDLERVYLEVTGAKDSTGEGSPP
jgi:gliding motility-associated transport system ATP-binding protein